MNHLRKPGAGSSITASALNLLALAGMAATAAGCASGAKHQQENDALKGEVQSLRGQVESLSVRAESLESQLRSMNERLEKTRANPPAEAVVPQASDTTGHPVSPVPVANDPDAGYVNDEAVQSYRKAMILFLAQQYPEAVLAFAGFVERHPDHPLAGSAQFYIGESYFKQREYRLAIQEYDRVLTSYDRSHRVGDALRQMSAAYDAIQNGQEAASRRQLLFSLFPQSPAARQPIAAAEPMHPRTAPAASSPTPASHDPAPAPEAPSPDSGGAAGKDPAPPSRTPSQSPALDEPPPPTAPLTTESAGDRS